MNKQNIVNLFAGPGAGKSTLAAGLFYTLKTLGHNVELVTEFAKDLTWENRHLALSNQVYVLGEQSHRLHRLIGQVDLIITDSPILLSSFYAEGSPLQEEIEALSLGIHLEYESLNVMVGRTKKYNPKGRNQTEDQASYIDSKIKAMLYDKDVSHINISGDKGGLDSLSHYVKVVFGLGFPG